MRHIPDLEMEISVVDRENFLGNSEREELVSLIRKTLRYLGLPHRTQICLSFVDDRDMRNLNRNYRQIDRTTDVLSFPQTSSLDRNLLGDIVISSDTAVRNSKRFGVSVNEEIRRLIVHAVLHLLGFDHVNKKQRDKMRAKESEILNFLDGNRV